MRLIRFSWHTERAKKLFFFFSFCPSSIGPTVTHLLKLSSPTFGHDPPQRCTNTKSLRINHRFWICFQFGHSGIALCWQLAPQCLSFHKTFIDCNTEENVFFFFSIRILSTIIIYAMESGINCMDGNTQTIYLWRNLFDWYSRAASITRYLLRFDSQKATELLPTLYVSQLT